MRRLNSSQLATYCLRKDTRLAWSYCGYRAMANGTRDKRGGIIMLKTVLKPDDVVGITFRNGSSDEELAHVSVCETREGSPKWTAKLTIVGSVVPDNSHRIEAQETLEAEAIETAIVEAMQFLVSRCNCAFVRGRMQGVDFTKTDIQAREPVIA